jgi:hypothetical protein
METQGWASYNKANPSPQGMAGTFRPGGAAAASESRYSMVKFIIAAVVTAGGAVICTQTC